MTSREPWGIVTHDVTPHGQKVVRGSVLVSGLGCPRCGGNVSVLSLDLPMTEQFVRQEPESMDDETVRWRLIIEAGDAVAVAVACTTCERSVKLGAPPIEIERAFADFVR